MAARTDIAIRPAKAGDLAAIRAIVDDAYDIYVDRIGMKPGPMLDDYAARIASGAVMTRPSSHGRRRPSRVFRQAR